MINVDPLHRPSIHTSFLAHPTSRLGLVMKIPMPFCWSRRSRVGTSSGNQTSRVQTDIPLDLPPEIWLSIFKRCRHYRYDLQNIALTRRSFHPLVQPLIFRTFQVTTYNPNAVQDALRNNQSKSYVSRFQDRLAFVSSKHIATMVQKITIRCYGGVNVDLPDCTEIHTSLFAVLHHFQNLSSIEACSVNFTTEIITQIFALANLRKLHLEWCRTDSSILALRVDPRSRVVELSYTEVELEGNQQVGPTGDPWWLRLLSRDKTKEIRISQPHNVDGLLRFITEGPAMTGLVTLTISSGGRPLFVAAMTKCPAIDTFILLRPRWGKEEIVHVGKQLQERGALSGVTRIAGPVELVLALLQTSLLKSIKITTQMTEEDSLQLVREIRDHRPEIVRLKLDIDRVRSRFIPEVLALPSLEWLEVVTQSLDQPIVWCEYDSLNDVGVPFSIIKCILLCGICEF